MREVRWLTRSKIPCLLGAKRAERRGLCSAVSDGRGVGVAAVRAATKKWAFVWPWRHAAALGSTIARGIRGSWLPRTAVSDMEGVPYP
jgi:hypothetical protein